MANPVSDSTLSSGDVISDSMTRIATTASKQRKLVAVAAVILLAATLAASLYVSKRNTYRAQAADALFRARTRLNAEMKTVADSLKPADQTAVKNEKTTTPKKKEAAASPSVEFVKFSVDAKLMDGITALQKVSEEFPNTLASYDAKMELGSLYFDHAESPASYESALKWFTAASTSAPSNEQTVSALYNLGFAQEALNRCGEAVKTFDRALNSGSGPLMGELLQAKARCQETLGDKAGAKATYESILKQLSGSEYAKFAETKKASL